MACKDIKFEIPDSMSPERSHEYFIMQWPAKKAMKMKFKIAKLLGSSLGELAKVNMSSKENMTGALTSALEKLFEKSSEDEVVDLIVEVIEQSTRDGERLQGRFDEIYSNNLQEAYKAFFKIVMGNYSDFFKGLNLGK